MLAQVVDVSADSWHTVLPGLKDQGGYTTGTTVLGQTQTAQTSDAHSEIAISAVMEQVTCPAALHYWDIPIQTTVAADTLGSLAYGITPLTSVSASIWQPDFPLSLADNGGSWVDLYAGGTPSGEFIDYYGLYYNTLYVCANGYVVLGADPNVVKNTAKLDDSSAGQATKVPHSSTFASAGAPNGAVAPYFQDLDPSSHGKIFYGYEYLTNTFVVWWNEVPTAHTVKYQTFFVAFFLASPSVPCGNLQFWFGYETMTSTKTTAAVGCKDPTGKYVKGQTTSWVGSYKELQFFPDIGNSYSIQSITVYARKYSGTTGSPQNDVNAWIPTATATTDAYPAGINMMPAGWTPPIDLYSDAWHKWGVLTTDYVLNNLPGVGIVYSTWNYCNDVANLAVEYIAANKGTPPPGSLPTVGTTDDVPCAYTDQTLCTMTQNTASTVKHAWVVPVFDWRINLEGAPYDHILKVWADVTILPGPGGKPYTLSTQNNAMWFTLKGRTLFTDNFDYFTNNVGLLSPWSATTAGTAGTVEVTSASRYPWNLGDLYPGYQAGSLHCYALIGQVARASVDITAWDVTQPYEVDFYYNQTQAGDNVLYDDSRVEIHFTTTNTLCAVTPSGDQTILMTSLLPWINKWHSICINADPTPGKKVFTVTVDGTTYGGGGYPMRWGSPPSRTITVGTQPTPSSGRAGVIVNDYWDLFGVSGARTDQPPTVPLLYDPFLDSKLGGWTTLDTNPKGYVGTTSTQSVSQPYSMEVKKSTTATGYASARHTFAAKTTGTIFVQAWMMVDSTCPAPAYFYVADSQVTFGFWNSMFQWYSDSTDWISLQGFSPGTWYQISFTINIDAGTYSIGIQQQGGTLTTYNNCYLRYSAPHTLDSVTFRAGWDGLAGAVNMYVDEVYVCQVSS
jgi:hypothetical protein